MPLHRVRAQRRAQLRHQGGCADTVTDDVADHDPDLVVRQNDDVVPVTADLVARRHIARGELDVRERRQGARQQAALQRDRGAMLLLERVEQPRALDRGRDAGGGQLEDRRVGRGEDAWRQAADVQHADEMPLDDQRHAEQRLDPDLPEDRVDDVGPADVADEDRRAIGGDAPGEPATDRDADAAIDLLLQTLGGPGEELRALLVGQEHSDGVDIEDLLDPLEDGVQKRLERQLGERRIAEAVEVREPCGRGRGRELGAGVRRKHDVPCPGCRAAAAGAALSPLTHPTESRRGRRPRIDHAQSASTRAPVDSNAVRCTSAQSPAARRSASSTAPVCS